MKVMLTFYLIPQDLRTATTNKLENSFAIVRQKLKVGLVYNVEFKAKPKSNLRVSKGFNGNYNTTGCTTGNGEIENSEGYKQHCKCKCKFRFHN
ncbi:hypothetical protein [Flavobacterium sp.]|uniref:hypothetical protein n=1 Tax=Flavobacterium sp. TaxID=239 RepID=UPI0035296F5E